ncbi:GNAT family N-acetyltransferase [Salinicoccus carnicancri]|uniref:GNAT family N-acetyltransferase n=1 Tax=Salinicoccus carnicancri TaxID=558170 RepID=UPI00031D698E|nr:GNAT family N-acetyltransferase [Salinicoccus carnicancri]
MLKKEDGKLFLEEEHNIIAELIYEEHDDYYDVTSTFTDPEYRNRGLAKDLVDEIVEMARDNDKKIQPTCPYVAAAIKDDSYDDVKIK